MTKPDQPLTKSQKERIQQLSEDDIRELDAAIWDVLSDRWQKLAYVIGRAMLSVPDQYNDLPDVFFADRLRRIVAANHLTVRGDITYIQYCEVRLPGSE